MVPTLGDRTRMDPIPPALSAVHGHCAESGTTTSVDWRPVRPCPYLNGYQRYAGEEREINIGGGCAAGSEDDRDSVRGNGRRGGCFGLWIERCLFNGHDDGLVDDSTSQASGSAVEPADGVGAGTDLGNRCQ